jgi:hypothetical protein
MPTTCRPPSPAPAVSLLPALSHLSLSPPRTHVAASS